MEEVKGYVEHIVFRNEDNGYTVFNLNNEDGELTCVGTFHYISEGELLKLTGEYVTHSLYGVQLQVQTSEVCEPEDLVSIERYLGSGAIKGLGAALAGRIVRRFKEDTFRIIEEEPERLAEIKGISERKAREIAEQIEEKKDVRRAMIYLQKYGISTTLAAKIYDYYGNRMYQVMEENPYQMADDISGVGFKTADEIARRIGIHADSDYRIRSGIFYTLIQSVGEGHIYLLEESLLRRTGNLLGVEIRHIEKYLMDLAMERKVVLKEGGDGKRVYASNYYYMELNTAKMLHDLNIAAKVDRDDVRRRLAATQKHMDMPLDERQRQAVEEAVGRGVMILTGGPGTGKTTTINAMIRYFDSEQLDIRLAAPTGRAAKRMTEATGWEAQTIHRLLEVNGNPEEEGAGTGFQRNMENPLEADVIIIDEMSMVDLPLMHALLCAICPGTRLILVGDVNQLPSVGPGSVLKDMIASRAFAVVELTRIFRQAGGERYRGKCPQDQPGRAGSAGQQEPGFLFPQAPGRQHHHQRNPHSDPEKAPQIRGGHHLRHPGAHPHAKGTAGCGAAEPDPAGIPESSGSVQGGEGVRGKEIPGGGQGHADPEQLPARMGDFHKIRHDCRQGSGHLQRRHGDREVHKHLRGDSVCGVRRAQSCHLSLSAAGRAGAGLRHHHT